MASDELIIKSNYLRTEKMASEKLKIIAKLKRNEDFFKWYGRG